MGGLAWLTENCYIRISLRGLIIVLICQKKVENLMRMILQDITGGLGEACMTACIATVSSC